MKVLITLGLTALMTNGLYISSAGASDVSEVIEPSKKSVIFFKKQVTNGGSIENTLTNLLDRYPQRTSEFVSIALNAYPEEYATIINASVSSHPMYVDDIIMVANELKVATPTEIVQIAVKAEPSYAGIATSAACEYSPNYFNDIVKTAVTAEPDSADQIAQKLVKAFPSKTMEILITTIKEVPLVGKYVLDALLATVTDDPETSEDMIIISIEQLAQYPDAIERLVDLAEEHDIDSEKIRMSAIKGGLSEKAIVAVITEHYTSQNPVSGVQ